MNHFGVAVEYGLHIMTQLAMLGAEKSPSAKALATFQGVPPAYLAKIMTKLDKAGLVVASEGKGGGYRLARQAGEITFLNVVDAIEGRKSLFQCTEVRMRCALYGGKPPKNPATVCAIHAVMLAAERRMREQLAATTVKDIAVGLEAKIPSAMKEAIETWFGEHSTRAAAADSSRKRKVR